MKRSLGAAPRPRLPISPPFLPDPLNERRNRLGARDGDESLGDAMSLRQLAEQASRLFPARSLGKPQIVQPLPGLRLLRHARATAFEATLYEPVVCLILQGRKETTLGDRTYRMGAGECLLISHDLPVASRITEAPYLALLLDVDIAALRGLHEEVAEAALDSTHAQALEVQDVDPRVLDAMNRFLGLASARTDAKVLGPLIAKEIHYRLLMAPIGAMLRSLVRHDSHASGIARAITHIRDDFRAAIAIPELARRVGMSPSSFHKHFKTVTASTPLQYQKDLRLLAARRLLLTGEATVTTAAFEVGYESPSQFSREYARKFGAPPSKDAASAVAALGSGRNEPRPTAPLDRFSSQSL